MKYDAREMVTFEAAKKFLDKEAGKDWYNLINLNTLDISNPKKCILGQLFDSYTSCKYEYFYGMNFDIANKWAFGINPRIDWVNEIIKLREEEDNLKEEDQYWKCISSLSSSFRVGNTYKQVKDSPYPNRFILHSEAKERYGFSGAIKDDDIEYNGVLSSFIKLKAIEPKTKEKQKYKHHNIVIAWLNGVPIQFKSKSSEWWEDLKETTGTSMVMPYFALSNEYRVKPSEQEGIKEQIKQLEERLKNIKG